MIYINKFLFSFCVDKRSKYFDIAKIVVETALDKWRQLKSPSGGKI